MALPRVSEGVFTPTIKLEHSDSRGELYSILLPGDRELMLLHSKEGALRGGHCHDVDELVVLLTGKMRYFKKFEEGNERVMEMLAGDVSFNPAGENHMGEFTEDSWVMEWKINTSKGKWRNIDYEPYRNKVRANAATG